MKQIIVILAVAILCSCKQQPLEFIYLPKLSGKATTTFDDEGENIYIYIQTSLVDNIYKDRKLLTKEIVTYFKENRIDICALPLNFDSYSYDFYEKTRCTKYFIKHAEDPGGFSSNIMYFDCPDDGIIDIYYTRDKQDPCKWVANIENYNIHYQDTIYCEGCKDKIYNEDIDWIPYNK